MLPGFRRCLQRPNHLLFRVLTGDLSSKFPKYPSAFSPTSTSAASPVWVTPQRVTQPEYTVGVLVADCFKRDAQRTALDIARSLGTLDKSLLISALSGARASAEGNVDEQEARELFESVDTQYPKGFLSK